MGPSLLTASSAVQSSVIPGGESSICLHFSFQKPRSSAVLHQYTPSIAVSSSIHLLYWLFLLANRIHSTAADDHLPITSCHTPCCPFPFQLLLGSDLKITFAQTLAKILGTSISQWPFLLLNHLFIKFFLFKILQMIMISTILRQQVHT